MAALRLGHTPKDVRFAVGHPARNQLIDASGDDFAAPRLQQPVAGLGRCVDHGTAGY